MAQETKKSILDYSQSVIEKELIQIKAELKQYKEKEERKTLQLKYFDEDYKKIDKMSMKEKANEISCNNGVLERLYHLQRNIFDLFFDQSCHNRQSILDDIESLKEFILKKIPAN